MGLIDADALKKALRKCQIESLIKHTEEKNVFDVINEQPTAYNVEQVISDLEREKMIICGCHMIETNVIRIDDAIEIVRKGGMNG